MRRVLVIMLVSCLGVATALSTTSASGAPAKAAKRCGVSADVRAAMVRTMGAAHAGRALRACAAKGGVSAIKRQLRAMLAAPSHRASAAAATIVVDDDGFATAANCDDAVNEVPTTIGAGLALAVAGDTVQVCPGNYPGGWLTEGVSVVGTGATKPVVGCAALPVFGGVGGAVLVGEAAGTTTVSGLDFEGGGCPGIGIALGEAEGYTVSGNTVNGYDLGIVGEFEAGNQIGPDNVVTAAVSGIVGFFGDVDLITDNYVGFVPNADIALMLRGIFVGVGDSVEDNSLTGGPSTVYGIYMDEVVGNHSTGNDISGHNWGVWVQDSSDVHVTDNKIAGNDYGLFNVATEGGCEQCGGPGRIGSPFPPFPDVVDGTNNWWGDASGPDDWGIGTGDDVSAQVDFFPWSLDDTFPSFRACDKRLLIPGNLKGTNKNDVLCGSGGQDRLNGRGGNDLLLGGGSKDVLQGRAGSDSIIAGGGDDFANGNIGNDSIQGRDGDDVCFFNTAGSQTSTCETFGFPTD